MHSTISTIQNRNYVEKGNVDGTERNYPIDFAGNIKEKQLAEKVGSDK
jgi:DNA topoisomerase-1